MWQRLQAVLQYLFIPFSIKTYNFLPNHTAACLTVRYSLITKFWPMRCKYSCVTPLGSVFKGTGYPLSHFFLLSTGWNADKITEAWAAILDTMRGSHMPRMKHDHERRNLNLELFQDAVLPVLDCSLLDFYVREINFYLLKVIIIFDLSVLHSQPISTTKRVRYKGTCCKLNVATLELDMELDRHY